MNLAAITLGKFAGEIAPELIGKVLHKIGDSNPQFKNLLSSFGNKQKISLESLHLTPEQMNQINHMQEVAQDQGLKEFDLEINGARFTLDIAENLLTPKC